MVRPFAHQQNVVVDVLFCQVHFQAVVCIVIRRNSAAGTEDRIGVDNAQGLRQPVYNKNLPFEVRDRGADSALIRRDGRTAK